MQVLSGDQKPVVEACAQIAGIPVENCRARQTPEEKSQWISALDEPVLMVGDGFNDALAMKAASVAVAIQGRLEMSLTYLCCNLVLYRHDHYGWCASYC